jgi:amidase
VRHDEYAKYDALGLAELVRKKQVSPRELADAAIARIEAVNPRLNAVVHRMDEKARRAAEGELPDGPFRGVPFLVKDLDGTLAGEPCTESSRALAGWVPAVDSELFARYKRAGLVICGKTNAPEFGIMGITEPELRGPCRNPWNLERTPGGSSGGAGAAVAARIVPMAHAGDGGGSIRIPASACGLYGLKPTRARTPLGPEVGESWQGLVAIHAVTRSVRDCAALLDATQGPDTGAPYIAPPPARPFLSEVGAPPGKLRIGFTTRPILGKATHPDCEAAVRDAAKLLASLGHEVVEEELPIEREPLAAAYLTFVGAGIAKSVALTEEATGVRPHAGLFEPTTWFLKQVGEELSAKELELARVRMHRTQRALGKFFETRDAYLTAALAHPPSKVGELALKPFERAGLALLRTLPIGGLIRKTLGDLASQALEKTPNTQVFNITGQPAASVPLYWSAEGMPIGVQVATRFGDEATLLRLSAQLEEARPWKDRAPAL